MEWDLNLFLSLHFTDRNVGQNDERTDLAEAKSSMDRPERIYHVLGLRFDCQILNIYV